MLFFFRFSIQMQADRTSNYVDSIRNEVSKSLIFCVLRSARADTYSAIKKLTCSEFGIPSQVEFLFFYLILSVLLRLIKFWRFIKVITGRNLKGAPNKLLSIATKVMIQIASKLGAEPWRATVPPVVRIIENVLINILFQFFYLLFRKGWSSDTIHTMMLAREKLLVLLLLRSILLSLVIILL